MVQQPYWMFPLWRKNPQYHTAQHTHSQKLICSFHSLKLSTTLPPQEWLLQGLHSVIELSLLQHGTILLSYDKATFLVSLRHRHRFLNPRQLHLQRGLNLHYWLVNVLLGKKTSENYHLFFFSSKNSKNNFNWHLYLHINCIIYLNLHICFLIWTRPTFEIL